MAQASHAATAVLHVYRDEQAAKEYLDDLQGMRKVSSARSPTVTVPPCRPLLIDDWLSCFPNQLTYQVSLPCQLIEP